MTDFWTVSEMAPEELVTAGEIACEMWTRGVKQQSTPDGVCTHQGNTVFDGRVRLGSELFSLTDASTGTTHTFGVRRARLGEPDPRRDAYPD